MATVKLDIISAKAQQAVGKSGKSNQADAGLFTEVFSAKLHGSRKTTDSDDGKAPKTKASSLKGKSEKDTEKNKLENAETTTDKSDDMTEQAENNVPVPAWFMLQLDQSSNETGLEQPIDTVEVDGILNVEAIEHNEQILVSADEQIPAQTLEEGADRAELPLNHAGEIIIDAKILPEEQGIKTEQAILDQSQISIAGSPADARFNRDGEISVETVISDIEVTDAIDDIEVADAINDTELNAETDSQSGQPIKTASNNNISDLNQAVMAAVREQTDNQLETEVIETKLETDMVSEMTDIDNQTTEVLQNNNADMSGGKEKDNSDNMNFFQTIRNDIQQTDNQVTENSDVNTENIYSDEVEVSDVSQFGKQLIERIDLRQLDQAQQLTVKLRPDEFGRMEIRLTRSSEGIIAQLISDTVMTRELLAQQANDLQQALRDQGFDIVQTEILSDFGDQQQDDQSYEAWQQMQEGSEINMRRAEAASKISAQMMEQQESQQQTERYATGSVDYFA